MKFGTVRLEDSEGAILAHAVRHPGGSLPKGHVLTASDCTLLADAGIAEVIAARLEPDDLGEDEAAGRLGLALNGHHLRVTSAHTGRVNIHAAADGLFTADRARVNRLNRIDPAITFACLESHVPVASGDMVATIKIIPLGVAGEAVRRAEAVLAEAAPIALLPFRAHAVTLIATELPSLKSSVMDKTARVLARRLAPSGSRLVREERVAHRAEAVADALSRVQGEDNAPPLAVVFGASAMTDFDDIIPAAIRLAGGRVIHAGMPVDPGNLLVLGECGGMPIIGAPGCARSPAENGFDWVLNRILAGAMPTPDDLTGFGVGGLLKEISMRPSPRDTDSGMADRLEIGAVVLAAGRASRMGEGGHKLLAEFDGEPLVRRSVRVVIEGGAAPVRVVTGYRADEVAAAVAGLHASLVDNPDYQTGMASSLAAGLDALAASGTAGMLVMLADMPGVSSGDIARMLAAFRDHGGTAIVRAVSSGKRGNPVILPRATFPEIRKLTGDTGARAVIETCGLPIVDVEIGPAAHLDVDTPEAVTGAGGILKG